MEALSNRMQRVIKVSMGLHLDEYPDKHTPEQVIESWKRFPLRLHNQNHRSRPSSNGFKNINNDDERCRKLLWPPIRIVMQSLRFYGALFLMSDKFEGCHGAYRANLHCESSTATRFLRFCIAASATGQDIWWSINMDENVQEHTKRILPLMHRVWNRFVDI